MFACRKLVGGVGAGNTGWAATPAGETLIGELRPAMGELLNAVPRGVVMISPDQSVTVSLASTCTFLSVSLF